MNRLFSVSIASLLAGSFICAQTHPRDVPHSWPAAESGVTGRMTAAQGDSDQCLVTFAFHGLMVFHPRGRLFEVGIVSGAPDHIFAIIQNDESKRLVPLSEPNLKMKDWRLEVRAGRGGASRIGIEEEGGNKGRFNRNGPSDITNRDLRWLVNFDDELHPKEFPAMFRGMFQMVLTITAGTLFTFCKTVPVQISRGGGNLGDFGSVAEIVGLEIKLQKGETLTLGPAGKGGEGGLSIPYKEGKKYGVFITNLPKHHLENILLLKNKSSDPHVQSTNSPPSTLDFGTPATHLQNYYLLFPVPPSKRREIRLKDSTLATECSKHENNKIMELLDPVLMTPDPYRCFEMSVSKSRRRLR